MSNESPWRTLAERLGYDWYQFELSKLALQDLIIGRALRVAWETHVRNGGELDKTFVLDVFWESSRPDARATAALELLDAVGYEHA